MQLRLADGDRLDVIAPEHNLYAPFIHRYIADVKNRISPSFAQGFVNSIATYEAR
jgi:hypothetical protein